MDVERLFRRSVLRHYEGSAFKARSIFKSGKRTKNMITKEQIKNTIRYCHKAGLEVRALFMIGFPFEKKKKYRRNNKVC